MDFAEEVFIRASLSQGTVYYIYLPHFGDWHYFVVLNKDLQDPEELYLVYATSKVPKVVQRVSRLKYPMSTVVHVPHTGYSHFTMDSCFNCNEIQIFTVDQLATFKGNGQLRICDSFPQSYLKQLVAAVKTSPKGTARIRGRI